MSIKMLCNKVKHVLPLTYDDSLSYYETLCKVTSKVNEVIGFINDELEQLKKEIKEMFRVQLNKLFIDSMYEKETETLKLIIKIKE